MYLSRMINPMEPWQEVTRLQEKMNRLFNDVGYGTQRSFPAVNLSANDDSAILTAELPGLENEDIQLSIVDQNVILEGESKPVVPQKGETYHRQERRSRTFKRSIQMPFAIDAQKVNATFKNGVLTITLPRAEEDKPRKIDIK